MVEVSLTVGKLDASLALLLTKDHHLIEFPTILLPNGVKAGSIVKISCERDLETEIEEQRRFLAVQEEILATFGKNLPKAPSLKIKNVTQTSCVLEWDPLDLGTASLKSLTLFKDGKKLGAIPQPLNNRTTKLSGLPIEKSFKFQLKLDSTAGVYTSDTVEVTTHKMTDLSGIQVCLGDISPNEHFTKDDIQQALVNMGAHHPASEKMKVETTHFVTTRENKQNPEFVKANEMNIPIIRPEWLKACEKERRIVGVRDFYVKDCVLPEIFAKNYWSKPAANASEDKKVETGSSEDKLETEAPGKDPAKGETKEEPDSKAFGSNELPVNEIEGDNKNVTEVDAEHAPTSSEKTDEQNMELSSGETVERSEISNDEERAETTSTGNTHEKSKKSKPEEVSAATPTNNDSSESIVLENSSKDSKADTETANEKTLARNKDLQLDGTNPEAALKHSNEDEQAEASTENGKAQKDAEDATESGLEASDETEGKEAVNTKAEVSEKRDTAEQKETQAVDTDEGSKVVNGKDKTIEPPSNAATDSKGGSKSASLEEVSL